MQTHGILHGCRFASNGPTCLSSGEPSDLSCNHNIAFVPSSLTKSPGHVVVALAAVPEGALSGRGSPPRWSGTATAAVSSRQYGYWVGSAPPLPALGLCGPFGTAGPPAVTKRCSPSWAGCLSACPCCISCRLQTSTGTGPLHQQLVMRRTSSAGAEEPNKHTDQA